MRDVFFSLLGCRKTPLALRKMLLALVPLPWRTHCVSPHRGKRNRNCFGCRKTRPVVSLIFVLLFVWEAVFLRVVESRAQDFLSHAVRAFSASFLLIQTIIRQSVLPI